MLCSGAAAFVRANFDPVAEPHTRDHLGEPFKAAQAFPAALGAHAELEDHREHAVAGEAAFGANG